MYNCDKEYYKVCYLKTEETLSEKIATACSIICVDQQTSKRTKYQPSIL